MLDINILIVEDKELLQLNSQLKEKVKNVFIVNDAKEAIKLMETEEIDIVLTDALPVNNGVEIVRYAIIHHTPIIPAVVVSKYKEFIKEWEELPYIKVLHKPVNIDVLYDNIITVLKESDIDMSENYVMELKNY